MQLRAMLLTRISLLLTFALGVGLVCGCGPKPLPPGACPKCRGEGKITTLVYVGQMPGGPPGQSGEPGQPGGPMYINQTTECAACGGTGKAK